MSAEVTPAVGITIILYIISELLKKTVLKNRSDLYAILPYVCAILGGGVAVVLFYVDQSILSIDNPFVAAITGVFSGLVATGANQLFKQGYKLAAVGHSMKEDIDAEVAGMTDEEKKEYMKDQITEVLEKVVDGIPQENSTEDNASDSTDKDK